MDFGIGDVRKVLEVIEGISSEEPLLEELRTRMTNQVSSILFRRIINNFRTIRNVEELLCDIILEKVKNHLNWAKMTDQEYRDPITGEILNEPVTLLKNGACYSKIHLEKFFEENGYVDPQSRVPLNERERKVVPTYTTKSRLQNYFEKFYHGSIDTINMCFSFLKRPFKPSSRGVNQQFALDLSTQDFEKRRFDLLGFMEQLFDLGNEYNQIRNTKFFKCEEKFYRSFCPHKMYKLIFIRKKQFDIILQKKNFHQMHSFYLQKVFPILTREEDLPEKRYFLELIYDTLLNENEPVPDKFLQELLQFYRRNLTPENRKKAVDVLRRVGLSRSFDYVLLYVDMLTEEELFDHRNLDEVLTKMCNNEPSKKSLVLQRCLQRDRSNTNLLKMLMDLYFATPSREDQEGFVYSQVFQFVDPGKLMFVLLPQMRELFSKEKEQSQAIRKLTKENSKMKKRLSRIEQMLGSDSKSSSSSAHPKKGKDKGALEELSPTFPDSSRSNSRDQKVSSVPSLPAHRGNVVTSYTPPEENRGFPTKKRKKRKQKSSPVPVSPDPEPNESDEEVRGGYRPDNRTNNNNTTSTSPVEKKSSRNRSSSSTSSSTSSTSSTKRRKTTSKKKKNGSKRGKGKKGGGKTTPTQPKKQPTKTTFADLVTPPKRKRIYVSPISPTVTKLDLSNTFKEFGPIVKIAMMEGYSYIDYYDEDGSKKAKKNQKKINIQGSRMKISFDPPSSGRSSTSTSSNKSSKRSSSSKSKSKDKSGKQAKRREPKEAPYQQSVFIGGIPEYTSERELARVLADAVGEKDSNKVIYKLYGHNIKKGFAFVDFKSMDYVDELLKRDKDGIIINEGDLRIDCYPIPKQNAQTYPVRLIGIPKYLGKQKIKKVLLEQAGWVYGISLCHEVENARIVKFVFRDDAERCLKSQIILDNGKRVSAEKYTERYYE